MFGPVITTENHIAFSGARTHSNEALSSLWSRGLDARDTSSCIYYDSKHAAGVCLGTVQARTHVQLSNACRQLIAKRPARGRLTTQHVHGTFRKFG